MTDQKQERLLTPRQVALRFAVDPKTVTRWARTGRLPVVLTPGGHRRYSESVINELAAQRYETERA